MYHNLAHLKEGNFEFVRSGKNGSGQNRGLTLVLEDYNTNDFNVLFQFSLKTCSSQ